MNETGITRAKLVGYIFECFASPQLNLSSYEHNVKKLVIDLGRLAFFHEQRQALRLEFFLD